MNEPLGTPVHRFGDSESGSATAQAAPGLRLQKILAQAGIASRRSAEQLITDGAVTINGKVVTELGSRADPKTDDIRVRGRSIGVREPFAYFALNKPIGYLSTAHDERGRPTVLVLLPEDLPERVYPVGRLDLNSEGLLLLTNDGELAERLTHPRHAVEKEYWAHVSPTPDDTTLAALAAGVIVDGPRTAPARVERRAPGSGNGWLAITIHEGRKRQIRLMCARLGLTVRTLLRVRLGPLLLGGLTVGKWRRLKPDEVRALRQAVGLPVDP